MKECLQHIRKELIEGRPICLFDFEDREAETDLIFWGYNIHFRAIESLRRKAGAPLSVFLDYTFKKKLHLPNIAEIVDSLSPRNAVMEKLLDERRNRDCTFSLSLDHRNNHTGCSAVESAYTIQRIAFFAEQLDNLSEDELCKKFCAEFKAPGHVPLLFSEMYGLLRRTGHIELAITLSKLVGIVPILVASEIIDENTGRSMSYNDAKVFSDYNGYLFITGSDILSWIR